MNLSSYHGFPWEALERLSEMPSKEIEGTVNPKSAPQSGD
jgi:hypothetical protein